MICLRACAAAGDGFADEVGAQEAHLLDAIRELCTYMCINICVYAFDSISLVRVCI